MEKDGRINEVDLGNRGASKRPLEWQKASEAEYIAYTIAKLGLEGWEMISVDSSGSANSSKKFYFKRPIE